jgi:hypothetical protein
VNRAESGGEGPSAAHAFLGLGVSPELSTLFVEFDAKSAKDAKIAKERRRAAFPLHLAVFAFFACLATCSRQMKLDRGETPEPLIRIRRESHASSS